MSVKLAALKSIVSFSIMFLQLTLVSKLQNLLESSFTVVIYYSFKWFVFNHRVSNVYARDVVVTTYGRENLCATHYV